VEARHDALGDDVPAVDENEEQDFAGEGDDDGGIIIMPMDMSMVATTMSMTTKGTKIMKPMVKARLSSPTMKAGMMT
jgi:hypothetical protein